MSTDTDAPSAQPTRQVRFVAYGTPAGQGQVSFLGKGRPAVHTNRARLLPWREAVSAAAQEAAGTHPHVMLPKALDDRTHPCVRCDRPRAQHGLLDGPLEVDLTVAVAPSAAAVRRGDPAPANRTHSDIDHHARAVLDALSHAAVWHDDAQVVDLRVRKIWTVSGTALDRPGAQVRVRKAVWA
ncbi:RusA family crossover junction endodeoxyribonuclease [Streptomyces sp. NBC_00669]|uniref:RusA family crossover junction endodeoxyribonuclease n=1 Tax=Streptomyces sp. NBC_00669 TaxID=2976011 RepID=UPI002E32CEF4|nr:RusA family crossover junction endodeoxyribonuclease [Streptomyces sp. NBC_00669]